MLTHVPVERVTELIGDALTDYAITTRRASAPALGAPEHVARYLSARGYALVQLPAVEQVSA